MRSTQQPSRISLFFLLFLSIAICAGTSAMADQQEIMAGNGNTSFVPVSGSGSNEGTYPPSVEPTNPTQSEDREGDEAIGEPSVPEGSGDENVESSASHGPDVLPSSAEGSGDGNGEPSASHGPDMLPLSGEGSGDENVVSSVRDGSGEEAGTPSPVQGSEDENTGLLFVADEEAIESPAPEETARQNPSISGSKRGDSHNTIHNGKDFIENEILVKFRDDERQSENLKEYTRGRVHNKVGATLKKDFQNSGREGLHLVTVPEGTSVEEVIAEYESDPSVEYAQPNYILSLPASPDDMATPTGDISGDSYPDDTYFPLQWALSNSGQEVNGHTGSAGSDIGILQVWEITKGSEEVVIAVIDTGVDTGHADLADNIWTNSGEISGNNLDDDNNGYIDDYQGYNFVDQDGDPSDDNGHGTHCAGTIGASGNNGIGVSGVAWNGRVMPLKCLNSQGYGSTADAIEAIGYATVMGADIVSISWGCGESDQALYEAISTSPALFVCAAGNSGQDNDVYPVYPASFNCDNIISVAATGQDDGLASFSNRGLSSVDLGAPGVNIISNSPSWKEEPYVFMSGTSMAVPYVAGVAGLIKAAEPDIDSSELRMRILESVDHIDSLDGTTVTGGRLNAAKAFGLVESSPAVPTPEATVEITGTATPTPVPTADEQVGSDTPTISPINPEYLDYVNEDPVIFATDDETGTEYGIGFSPSPYDSSYLEGMDVEISGSHILSYPSSYDLRTNGGVTSVKNQGSCGSCWAFATFGSLESYLIHTLDETWNFAEDNLIKRHGFDYGPCAGGNYDMSAAYLTRWTGPLLESQDPYLTSPDPTTLSPSKHVQDVMFIPPRSGSLDNDNIKEAVMTYGGVCTSFYWNSAYYNSGAKTYYYSGSASPNHGVVIVGWDDYKITNAGSSKPGAFIIKNSWGSGWGEGGYFYMSYYDSKVGRDNAVFTGEPVDNYDNIYQYDPLGRTTGVGTGSSTTYWGANVFTATRLEMLQAVGTYASSPNTEYWIYIYRNPTSGPINPAGYECYTTGTIAIPGYHTIQLPSPVSLSPGERFSVVIRYTTPGYNYPVPMEYPFSGYSSGARASAGQSYFSGSGTYWSDMTGSFSNSNVCIKGYTTDGGPPEAKFVGTPGTGVGPSEVQFSDTSTNSPTSWQWDVDGDSIIDYTTQNPSHTYDSEGTYSVSLTVTNNYGSDSITKTDYITVVPPPPFMDSGWSYRKLHTIAGSPDGDLTDYQMKFVVHRTDGTDSGEDVYVGTNCNDDYSDLRFTTIDNTQMSYWIESYDANSATVWVKVPSIPTSGTQIYLYYGNPVAESASNGDDTFTVFDDFSGDSLDTATWTVLNGNGQIYVEDGKLHLDYTGSQNNDWWSNARYQKILVLNSIPDHDFEAIVTLEPFNLLDRNHAGIGVYASDTSSYVFGRMLNGATDNFRLDRLGTGNIAAFPSTDLPAKLNVRKEGNSFLFGIDTGTGWSSVGGSYSDISFNSIALFGKEWGTNNLNAVMDDFFIRKVVQNGPIPGDWDLYEVNTIPPNANFSATPSSGQDPVTVQFTDLSSGSPTTWEWDVDGDSIIDYTDQNPSHTYETEDTYTVSLTVTNDYGADSITKTNYISVVPPPPFLAGGWSYRKLHTISGSPDGDLTDYQVRFVVHRTSGTDSGEDVFLGTNCNEDYSDLRFTTIDNTPMSYWIEEIGTDSATVWVKVPSIPTSGIQLYLYYGNPAAESASNGDDTFPIFDDFSGNDLDTATWTVLNGNGQIYVEDGKLHLDYTGSQNNDWWSNARYQKILVLNSIPDHDFEAIVTLEPFTVRDRNHAGIGVYASDTSSYVFGRMLNGATDNFRLDRLGTGNIAAFPSTDLPAKLNVRKDGNSCSFGIDTGSGWSSVGGSYSDISFNSIALFGKEWGTNNLNAVMDDFFIRKVVQNGPTPGDWDLYEVNTIPPNANFSATPSSGQDPVTVQFTDLSSGSPTTWEWDVDGDSVTDYTTQNPSHTYDSEGTYSVSLTVTNDYGANSITKTEYITVVSPPPFIDGGWSYRKLHTISGSPDGDLTDYQIKFVVHRTSGTDSGEDVYVGTNCNDDYSDLRFATIDNPPMSYWIESYDADSALIWVKVPSIPTSGIQLYLYYGNPVAESLSNGDDTFTVFDDFSGDSLDTATWTVLNGNGQIYVEDGKLHLDYTGSQNNDWWSNARYQKILVLNSIPDHDFEAIVTLEPFTVRDRNHAGIGVYASDTSSYVFGRMLNGATDNFRLDRLGTGNIAAFPSTDLPAKLNVRKDGNSCSFGIDTGTGWSSVGGSYSDISFNSIALFGKEWGTNNLNAVMDDFFIRKVVQNGPTPGDWDLYEVNTIPPNANFSANPVSGQDPVTVQFTDLSSGSPTTWEWDVDGDSVIDYTTQNPSHTYDSEGTYSVTLTVTNNYGSDSITKTDYITVVPPPPFLAGGWSYRKLHTIAGSPDGDLTDHQMKFVVHHTSGTDSGEDVYVGTNCNDDYSDLRFTTIDNTQMSYWIESYDADSATVWVKVPSIPTSGIQLYLYYGNPAAESLSNGDDTFTVFDDFSGDSLDTATWTVLNGNGQIYVEDGKLHLDYTGSQNNDWWSNARYQKILVLNSIPDHDFEAVVTLEPFNLLDRNHAGIGVYASDTSSYVFGRVLNGATDNFRLDRLGTGNIAAFPSTDLPAKLNVRKDGNSCSFGIDTGTGWSSVGGSYSDISFNSIALFGKEWGTNNLNAVMDDFFIRKVVQNGPTPGDWEAFVVGVCLEES